MKNLAKTAWKNKALISAKSTVMMVVVSLSLVGCGGGGGDGAAGNPQGVASLGIDPLGRGDGFDISEGNYAGRCYQDDDLEANRPMGPDPRRVAAEEAEEIALASQTAADLARAALEIAKQEYEDSFVPQAAPPREDSVLAGIAYMVAVTAARDATEKAYNVGLDVLAPEKVTTWADIFEHPDKLFKSIGEELLDPGNYGFTFDDTGYGEIITDLVTDVVKKKLLALLKDARDLALAEYNAAVNKLTPELPEPVADPIAQANYEAALANYEAAQAQTIADANAAFEARMFAETAPSDLPPCDSEELGQALYTAFCTGNFVNPITPEEEANVPGITESLNNYIEEVCDAVS